MEDLAKQEYPLLIKSEDGVIYQAEPFEATTVKLNQLWQRAGRHSFLFSDVTVNDEDKFYRTIMSPEVVLFTISNEQEEIGIVYADKIIPKWSARAHYFFWDYKQKGRGRVLLSMLRWFMGLMNLQRMDIEIMQFAYSALRRMHIMGVRLEGVKRRSILSKDRWVNQLTFGVLRDELTNEAIENARIPRSQEEDSWFGLLDKDYALARAIFKEE
jgi:hypothetical protein